MNNVSGNMNCECMDHIKLNQNILENDDDDSSSQKECSEKNATFNCEDKVCENNLKLDDACDGKTTNELVEIASQVESLKNNFEFQSTHMDSQIPENIWKEPLLNVDQEDPKENEELSSFFGPTRTIRHVKECCCQTCTTQRAFVRDKIKKTWNWQSQGYKLREYIRSVFDEAIKCPCVPNIPSHEFDPIQYEQLQQIVEDLVKNHPHKFFLMLAIQAQEFVVELKIRIMQPFEHNSDIDEIAEIFLTRLLNGYDVLINTAIQVTKLIKLLEEKHLSKFNLTWEFYNKKLYQNYIYFHESIILNILPFIIRQLRKSCKKSNDGYKLLLERYLHFVDEMMKTARLWPEKELMIGLYNTDQIAHILSKYKNNPGWTIWKLEEAVKVENEQTIDVPGLGLNQKTIDTYFEDLIESKPIISDNIEFVRKTLDTWATQAYQTLATNYLGIHWFKAEENSQNDSLMNNRNIKFHFGYESGASLVLNYPNDNIVKIETNCSVCGDLTWISHLVINGRTKTGLCTHPALQKNEEKLGVNDNHPTDDEKQYKYCCCIYRHLGGWEMATYQGLLLFPPCLCMLNIRQFAVTTADGAAPSTCLCIKSEVTSTKKSNDQHTTQTFLPQEQSLSDIKPSNGAKVTSTSTQTQHSAVQTLNVPHNCSDHDNHHNRNLPNGISSKETMKTTGSFSKIRNLKKKNNNSNNNNNNNNNNNTTSYSCLSKRSNIEQIRRVSCNSVDGNYSDSASIEDSCSSVDSLTPRENGKHCDCCYCEVFGHGVPSVASVSRNYNETRERLRQLLTKKKAKTCSSAICHSPPSPIESITVSNSNSCNIDIGNTNLVSNNPEPKPITPVPQSISTTEQSQKQDNRDLNVLLDFIEGNQAISCKKDINIKKSEKKARQKQKKFENNLKLQQEELDRKKLVELQKKTPGVTITVVDPQKPISQKLLLNRNLPEVSILPATLSHQQRNVDNSRNCFSKNNSSNSNSGNNSITNSNSNNISKVNNNSNNNNNVKQRMTSNKDILSDKKGTRVIGINEILNSSHSAKCIKDQEKLNEVNKSMILNSKNKKTPESMLLSSQSQLSLTKKQRKKLKREMKKMEEAKIEEQKKHEEVENQPQIVTIKRVMESNSAEPTVTITLKGQTPAEDKVLFTLINGQTKEPIQEQQLPQNPTGKKKKKKKKNQDNNSQTIQQQTNKMPVNQQNVLKSKNQSTKGNDKILKDQSNNGKNKIIEQENSQKIFLTITKELSQNNGDNKSKKNKKNVENKQPLTPLQQKNSTKNKNQHHGPVENEKKQKKPNATGQPLAEIKNQSNVNNLTNNVSNKKKNKALKQQTSNNNNSNTDNSNNKKNIQSEKINNKNNNKQQTLKADSSPITQIKTTIAQQSISKLLRTNIQHNKVNEQNGNSLSSQLKDSSSKINIENLRLPPGITITKVDAPVKPLPIKSTPLQKQSNNTSKQATIIAAPMSTNNMQPNYNSSGSQSPGNVIVVDTGKLKQDLLPNNEKGSSKEQNNTSSNSKKKKKKKKNNNNSTNNTNNNNSASGNNKSGIVLMSKKSNDSTSKYSCNDQARIVHNPGSNMVTIRNPAFGSVPKMEPLQQAAIIKLSENGMVTIRSPALQQAINAGLTPPPKPDFIVKGDFVTGNNNAANSKTTIIQSNHVTGQKCTNNGFISSNLSELRNKLSTPKCGNLTGFGNIQISKVTNGQSIPENGINLKGTSVTLTKINSPETVAMSTKINDNQQSTGSKTKKKKKKSSGTKSCGDDWNLVESVFTPKDIDLEDGEMDDAERELEAFKRFCLQSVPPPRKEKVNLNIKDIVLKKKSSSTAAAAAIIAAN